MIVNLLLFAIVSMLIAILIVYFIFNVLVLKGDYYNAFYRAVLNHKNLIIILLGIMVLSVPIIFLNLNKSLIIYDTLIVYLRELFYSILFVITFIITWNLINKEIRSRPILPPANSPQEDRVIREIYNINECEEFVDSETDDQNENRENELVDR